MDHLSYKTAHANKASVEKNWVIVDAKDQVLGRIASQVAKIIRGKHKTSYTPNVDCGDHVIVINAEKIKMTGKKWTDRVLFTHSGFPGGIKERTLAEQIQKDSTKVIYDAVRGMLPKNKLLDARVKRLKVFPGAEHNHSAQTPEKIKVGK